MAEGEVVCEYMQLNHVDHLTHLGPLCPDLDDNNIYVQEKYKNKKNQL